MARALDLDLRRRALDLAQLGLRQLDPGGTEVLVEAVGFVVPGMGTIQGLCASPHAAAS